MDIAPYLPQLMLAWSIQIMGVLSPGPGVALIVGVATSQGRLPSLLCALGIACGSIVLAVSTVVGITALLSQVAEVMTVVRLAGAAYLAYLAYRAFSKMLTKPALAVVAESRGGVWRTAVSGFLLQISNPKAIMFWLAIAGVGGVGEAPLPVTALFVVVAFVNSFVGHGGYALLLSSTPVRAAYLRAQRWIEGGLGCFFLFASFSLAVGRR